MVKRAERQNIEQRGGALMRLRGLMRKEFLQILRDPSSIAIAFLMPVVLLLLFGYGVSLDAEHVPITLVVEHPSAVTSRFTKGFLGSRYFNPNQMLSIREGTQSLLEHEANGLVYLREDFAESLQRTEGGAIQVIINGVDANNARLISGYVEGVWNDWIKRESLKQGSGPAMPVQVQQRIWFNSEVRSQNFLVPGLIAVIMTLIGALLTALIMSREWERGTMEALMVSPVAMREVIIGKLVPYFLLGMGGMTLSVVMAVFLFHVPLRGSLWLLFAGAALFLLTALGMGLLISTLARSQFVASQVAIIATFLPAFILSGFIFDIGSMPTVIQGLTHIVAARYFVAILQSVFLAGNVWSVVLPNALALIVMATIFLGITRRRSRKRLE
ncbi:MAG: ABC transporter permease [Desulfoferrobacter sp.]